MLPLPVLAFLCACLQTALAASPPVKGYSGLRARNDSTRIVYFCEQAVAVVEIGKKRELFNCEVIEVYEKTEQQDLLDKLSSVGKIYKISFKSMMDLMQKCDELPDRFRPANLQGGGFNSFAEVTSTALNGVLPGTKWCGNGDIAKNYFDLGIEKSDKCCRRHDLCPLKVRASTSKYGIDNKGFSISHCSCDDELHKCLKSTNSSAANAMGLIYFDILQTSCLDGSIRKGFKLRPPKRYKER